MHDPAEPGLPQEFLDLVDQRLAGIITPAEQLRLEWHLLHTPGATAYYLELAATEALLPDALLPAGVGSSAPENVFRPPVSVWRRRAPVALGLAASLALLAGIGFLSNRDEVSRVAVVSAGVPARLTRSLGARWTEGETRAGARLSGEAGAITAGFVELTFDSGVKLLVEGPAAYRITGRNACRLAYGKAVADVPGGAKGFILDGPAERIIDHGTRFAVAVAPDGGETTVGVLSGEVEMRHGDRDVFLYTDYALNRSGDTLTTVPFEKGKFTTEMPSREFDWSLDDARHDTPVDLRFDVSRLIHGPGDFRAVFKWFVGLDAIDLRRVELRRDGRPVAVSTEHGVAGLGINTFANAPLLHVAPADFGPGRWELVATVSCDGSKIGPGRPVSSRGIVTLEDGLSLTATAKDFVGRWSYSHNGEEYVREFGADGSYRMTINGKIYLRTDLRYEVRDGILSVQLKGMPFPELHMLRDDGTLVFLNQPYRNARRR